MSQNFKLSYNMGFNYVDLFPKSTIEAIKFNQDTSYQSSIFVTIPPSNDLIQTIPIPISTKYLDVPVYMKLLDNKNTDQYDYSTISQFQIIDGNLKIVRLFTKPIDFINVLLVFGFNSGNALKYSEVIVTVPTTSDLLQNIPIQLTDTQKNAPFSIKLKSVGQQAVQDFATITQIKIEENNLIIARLFEKPKNSIDVVLKFKEGGI